ncbi:hypothetical protein Tco_0475329 [Tanacetum coccineum]
MESGFLSRKGGRGLKENHNGLDNIDIMLGLGLDFGFPLLVDVTRTIHIQDGGLTDGDNATPTVNDDTDIHTSNIVKVVNVVPTSPTKNGSDHVMKEAFLSYVIKHNPKSLTKANLRKLDANVQNDANFNIWLPLASVHEFHDVLLVAYTSDGLSSIAMKIGTPMMLNSFTNSMCLESWVRAVMQEFLIEIDACNGFGDNLVMAVPNLKDPRYTKKIIRVEYEWEHPRCSTFFIFGHSVDDCLKVLVEIV